MATLFLTKDGTWRKKGGINKKLGFPAGKGEARAMKEGFCTLLEDISHLDDLKPLLEEILLLPDPSYSDEEWAILCDLLYLLPAAEAELKGVFAEEGTVDFQEVSRSAIEALGREDAPSDLMLALDMKLQHILVDEFQDTSRTQWALLEGLTSGWEGGDGRTLFIVGDPMQSIYLFREAEVGLFLQARDRCLGNITLTPKRLTSNFRSEPVIIDWVNATFLKGLSRSVKGRKGPA
jgi:ATP-dependent exoDNAse (exonuclease V) beta subunit